MQNVKSSFQPWTAWVFREFALLSKNILNVSAALFGKIKHNTLIMYLALVRI